MRAIAKISAIVTSVGLTAAMASAAPRPPKGFSALFNSRDLSGWHGMPHFDPRRREAMPASERKALLDKWMDEARTHWSVEGSELVNDGKGPFLTTDRDYGDIELRLEYKTVAKADSGVYLRGTPQVQIWDTTREGGKWDRNADRGSGGLFNNTKGKPGQLPLVRADRPFGQWNDVRIVQVGARTSVWLNGQQVVDHAIMENFWDESRKTPLYPRGPIQLQTHGGEIRWRNIYGREIPADEANRILASHGDQGFERLSHHSDLRQWRGATQDYHVVGGAIACKKGRGGHLFTEREYGDFSVRLEIKLPPAGNSGLAIRYPGEGAPAYDGMCEVQVLDDGHPKYAGIDSRQAHGSAYGMVAAHRGYLRKTGEWNFEEVTVKGSRVTVELNGAVILDADLSEVKELMDGKPHPGKDRTKGHFGFAGHDDPVMFRQVRIKPLD